MNINTEVYGLTENWQPQFFRQRDSENQPEVNKCPSFNNNNYSQLYYALQNNRVNTNEPIDISISYCALGEESASSHRHSIVKNENNEINILSSESELTNFFFWERTGNSLIFGNEGVLQRNKSWYGTVNDGNINAQISPYCSINVHNQVLGIRVWAMNSAKTAGVNFQLSEYLNNYQNYPYVVSVYLRSYNGYQTPRDSNMLHGGGEYGNIKFGMGLLNPYKYSDNTDIYNYAIEQDIETAVVNINSNMAIIMGSLCPWQYANISENYVPVLKAPDLSKWTIEFTNENYNRVRIYQTITQNNVDEFFEECLKQAACFGLYFSPKESVCLNGDYTNEDMYIGILENGIGHGKYLKGEETINAPQNEYENMNENPYDAHNPPKYDNTIYTNNTQFYYQIPAQSAIKYYVMTENQVKTLFSELFKAITEDAPQGTDFESRNQTIFATTNGIDCITSLFRFPCEILKNPISSYVYLGTYKTDILANLLLFTTGVYDFSFNYSKRNSVYKKYNDFRDFEPYTKCELTIPFCGTTQIPLSYIYNYDDLEIKLIIDFITGACTAVIMSNGIAIDTLSGVCGIQFPITGIQANNLDAQIFSKTMDIKAQQSNLGLGIIGGAIAIGAGIATGGIAPTLAGAAAIIGSFAKASIQGEEINYDLKHMELPIKSIGGASGQISQTMDMRCKMKITRPIMKPDFENDDKVKEVYARTVGYTCLKYGKVKDFSGLTIGEIVVENLSERLTKTEIDMIKQKFRSGVYL